MCVNSVNEQVRFKRGIQLGSLIVGLLGVLLLTGCVESSSSRSTPHAGSYSEVTRPYDLKNVYSGEIRIFATDRYTGHPLRGVTVEVLWIRQNVVISTSRIVTDQIGFGRTALSPVQRSQPPYDAVSVKYSLSSYSSVYQEQSIHWRLIGPLPSGADEWRFDVELCAEL